MAKPSKDQIKAVRAVLYKPERVRQLRADANSIGVLMKLNNPVEPEDAPLWTIPATGNPSGAVVEAVARCRKIAATLRTMRSLLGDLALPPGHKQDLRTGLGELAATWDARAAAWAAPGAPDVEAQVAKISAHFAASTRALRRVSAYLRTAEGVGG